MNSFSIVQIPQRLRGGELDALVAAATTIGSRSRFQIAADIADTIGHTPEAQRPEKPPYGFLAMVELQAKACFFRLTAVVSKSPFRCATPAWRKGFPAAEPPSGGMPV